MLEGQFTYGTVPGPGPYSTAAGWKVIQVLPELGLSPELVQAAVLNLGTFQPRSVPMLALPGDLDGLPVRLRLEKLHAGYVALICQQSCGLSHDRRDSSYAHGLILNVEDGLGLGLSRPAELWKNTAWKHPIGADQVAACRLSTTDEFSLARDAGTAHGSVVSSAIPENADLWDSHPDVAKLVLAVFENLAKDLPGIRHLAILDEDGTAAATWAAFLARHVFPGSAWKQIGFSTHEENVALHPPGVANLMMIGVPAGQSGSLRLVLGDEWLIVDPDRPPINSGGAAPAWNFPDGRELLCGSWTQLMEQLNNLDSLVEGGVTGLVDSISLECRGTADGRPLWAAPAALLLNDFAAGIMSESAGLAAGLVFEQWPETLALRADLQAVLVERLKAHDFETAPLFERALRVLDRSGSLPGRAVDSAAEGYFSPLWGASLNESRPAWIAERGVLPWMPTRIRPSLEAVREFIQKLPIYTGSDGLSSETPDVPAEATTGFMGIPSVAIGGDDERSGDRVRLLGSLAMMADLWGCASDGAVRRLVSEPLVDALFETIRLDKPVCSGDWGYPVTPSSDRARSWPTLPPDIVRALVGRLENWLEKNPHWAVGSVVAAWLDRVLGPLELDESVHPFARWTSVEIARVLYLQPSDRSTDERMRIVAVQLAGVASRVSDPLWSKDEWVAQIVTNFGRMLSLAELAGFLDLLIGRDIAVPVPALAEFALRTIPISTLGHRFATWVRRPEIVDSKSARCYAPWSFQMFPVLALHADCSPELPTGMEPGRDLAWNAELRSLQGEVLADPGPLGESVRLRAVADILLVDMSYLVESREMLPGKGFGERLVSNWFEQLGPSAFGAIQSQIVDDPARRLRLARSLLIRAFMFSAGHRQGYSRLRDRFDDPAGWWLGGVERHGDPMLAESLVRELLRNVDSSGRQRWVDDIHAEAKAVIKSLAAPSAAEIGYSASNSLVPVVRFDQPLVVALLDDIDQKAAKIALGTIGRIRARSGRRDDDEEPPGPLPYVQQSAPTRPWGRRGDT